LLHEPVLKEEVLKWLELSPGSRVVDATAGFGGHTEALWDGVMPGGRVIAIDRDAEAIEHCRRKFESMEKEIQCFHENYRTLERICRDAGMPEADAVLIDCGVSLVQLGDPRRGFSFRSEGPLDMRMDIRQSGTLRDCLRDMDETTLADIIYRYGQERYSRRIARAIKEAFGAGRVQNTRALAEVIRQNVPVGYRRGRIHPATRTFQAFRIHVNDELGALEEGLNAAIKVLSHQGRTAVITFHSLEDGMVKRSFHSKEKEGWGIRLTKKPIVPGQEEIRRNPRARSAKLRVFERRT